MSEQAYAIVKDVPASWADYRRDVVGWQGDALDGLLIRVAGPTAEGVRVIEIWRSKEQLEQTAAPIASETVRELVVAYLLQPERKET
jgi:hypothetical protein